MLARLPATTLPNRGSPPACAARSKTSPHERWVACKEQPPGVCRGRRTPLCADWVLGLRRHRPLCGSHRARPPSPYAPPGPPAVRGLPRTQSAHSGFRHFRPGPGPPNPAVCGLGPWLAPAPPAVWLTSSASPISICPPGTPCGALIRTSRCVAHFSEVPVPVRGRPSASLHHQYKNGTQSLPLHEAQAGTPS